MSPNLALTFWVLNLKSAGKYEEDTLMPSKVMTFKFKKMENREPAVSRKREWELFMSSNLALNFWVLNLKSAAKYEEDTLMPSNVMTSSNFFLKKW